MHYISRKYLKYNFPRSAIKLLSFTVLLVTLLTLIRQMYSLREIGVNWTLFNEILNYSKMMYDLSHFINTLNCSAFMLDNGSKVLFCFQRINTKVYICFLSPIHTLQKLFPFAGSFNGSKGKKNPTFLCYQLFRRPMMKFL